MNIVKKRQRVPPLRALLFGPAESWKTSSLACVGDKALWLDFHGSTATLAEQPNCAFDPQRQSARPLQWPDVEELFEALASDEKLRRDFDWVMIDGLDDVERLYLVPEALRRTGEATLGASYGKPMDMLVSLHKEFLLLVERLWLAGFSIGMTCHEQRVERINPDGANYMVTEISLAYQAGKVGKWDCPAIWRDWCDMVVYLTTEGRKVVKGDKDKIGKARGDVDQHVAYLSGEAWLDSAKARRCESLESPLKIKSPLEFWETLVGTWRGSFAAPDPAFEALRVEVLAMCDGVPAAQRAARQATSAEALEKIRQRRREETTKGA